MRNREYKLQLNSKKEIIISENEIQRMYEDLKKKLFKKEIRSSNIKDLMKNELIQGIDKVFKSNKVLFERNINNDCCMYRARKSDRFFYSENDFLRKNSNRMDPPGFVYLAYSENVPKIDKSIKVNNMENEIVNLSHRTCIEELKAEANDKLSIGRFKFKNNIKGKLIDLSFADNISLDDIEYRMAVGYKNKKDIIVNGKNLSMDECNIDKLIDNLMDNNEFVKVINNEAILNLIVKLLSGNLFKQVYGDYTKQMYEYGPNHAITHYCLEQEQKYNGIIYKSTKMDDISYSKNIVIFDQDLIHLDKSDMIFIQKHNHKNFKLFN
jgi:hypothetical protein